eukprot:scaffold177460_cov21-Tisochrysis_lutea.AAC.2
MTFPLSSHTLSFTDLATSATAVARQCAWVVDGPPRRPCRHPRSPRPGRPGLQACGRPASVQQ